MVLKRLNKQPIEIMEDKTLEISDMVNKLIETIGREAALFESFLELLEIQQKMLVEHNLEGLKDVTVRQQEKLSESYNLNKERLELIEKIREVNQFDGDLDVSRLIEIIDKVQADRLTTLQETILTLNDKITETRNQNAMLLNRSREYIMKTMDMLSKINSPKPTYTAQGKSTEKNSNIAVDRRA